MVVSLKANRKRILAFILLAAIVAGACFFLTGPGGGGGSGRPIPGGTNEERVAFLESFGWQVQAEPSETREVMIPCPVQRRVHRLQRDAAGPRASIWSPTREQICTQYVYKVENHPGDDTEVYATLAGVRG